MERISYILIALAAGIIGILLFALGYSTIRYHRARGKWMREFWISVAIVLAFLTTTFYGCGKESELPKTEQSIQVSTLKDIWQELTTTTTTQTTIDTVKYEQKIDKLIDQIREEKNLSKALKSTLKALVSLRLRHISRTRGEKLVTCYKMSQEGVKRMKALTDLERQYRLTEDMAKENKINQETFDKVRVSIRKNLEILVDWSNLSKEEQDRLVNLVIELCGVEAQEPSSKSQGLKLEDTPEWKAVVEQWQVVSRLGDDKKTTDELAEIRKETKQRLGELRKLGAKGLISMSLTMLIEKDFNERQEVKPLDVTCYEGGGILPARESWRRLKDRLPLLEKVFKKNRINEWTYNKIILALKEDLAILEGTDEKWYRAREGITEEDIRLLKEKASELFQTIDSSRAE